jgi:nucleoside phosphorylase
MTSPLSYAHLERMVSWRQLEEIIVKVYGPSALAKVRSAGSLATRFAAARQLLDTQPDERAIKMLSGNTLGKETPLRPESAQELSADVVFICALRKPELEALRQVIGKERWRDPQILRDPYQIEVAQIKESSGITLQCVAAAAQQMGLTAAAVLTSQLLHLFKPQLVIMTGIAAGIDPQKQGFGDILVGKQSFNYIAGKRRAFKNGGFASDPQQVEIPDHVSSLIAKLSSEATLFETIRAGFTSPPPRPLGIHLGPIGSADQVIDDKIIVTRLIKSYRKLIGLDMETYAVYRACREFTWKPPVFISVKSICDFASQKTDKWQAYAAYTSAAFAYELLRTRWSKLVQE